MNARICCLTLVTAVFATWLLPSASAEEPVKSEAVEELLKREPMSLETWPDWRERLLAWLDMGGPGRDRAFAAAHEFIKKQTKRERLLDELKEDSFAWFILGDAYLTEALDPKLPIVQSLPPAIQALQESVRLDPNLAQAHLRLAVALVRQEEVNAERPDWHPHPALPGLIDAGLALKKARELDPTIMVPKGLEARMLLVHGKWALRSGQFTDAEHMLVQALEEFPGDIQIVRTAAMAIEQDYRSTWPKAERIQPLIDKFPNDGVLAALQAGALIQDGDVLGAQRELQRARSLGVDPAQVLLPIEISRIERNLPEPPAPALTEQMLAYVWPTLWTVLGCLVFYVAIVLLMPVLGLVPGLMTWGKNACRLLGPAPRQSASDGQPIEPWREPCSSRLYALMALGGLVLHYLTLLLFLIGLMALAWGLIILLAEAFRLQDLSRREASMLAMLTALTAGLAAWTLFRSLFAPHPERFGLLFKPAEDAPRLQEVLSEVERRLEVPRVDKVYLVPGAGIRIFLEERGPFGIFGVRRRVLLLGVAALHWLTVRELQALLAQQLARRSRRGSKLCRVVDQAVQCYAEVLEGMKQSHGWFKYCNPFFWLLYFSYGLHYRCLVCLAAGFLRSRVFLADRLASGLYGSDALITAMNKVGIDGPLFEAAVQQSVARLLKQKDAYSNLYEAFRNFSEDPLVEKDRQALEQQESGKKSYLFAPEPTLAERQEVLTTLPRALEQEDSPAISLLETPEDLEKHLTNFLTAYLRHGDLAKAKLQAYERDLEEVPF